MAKKAKWSEENPPSQEPAPQAPKKPTILGTDLALSLPTAQGTSLHLSYWDLWFALVAVMMHNGDLDRLANQIKEERGFFEVAVQVTEMPPLPLNRSSVVEEAFLLLDPIRQSV